MTQSIWWVPLLAALCGGALALTGNVLIERLRLRRETESLALAFRGELLAVTGIVEIRNYERHLGEALAMLQAGHCIEIEPLAASKNYFLVYEKNASRIGILPADIAEGIATAYTYANSFLEDVTRPRPPKLEPRLAPVISETLDVLRLSINKANDVVRLIENTYMPKRSSI